MKNTKNKIQSGFVVLASTLGIFVTVSFFAFYLARFSANESATGGYYIMDIKARNLASTGIEHGLQLIRSSFSSFSSPVIGNFNNGSYKVTLNTSVDEIGSNLQYNHYGLLKSEAEIGQVKRNARLIISSYPDAFNLAFYGKNDGGSAFSSSSTINGDIYFNGNIGSVNLASGKIAYTSLTNSGTNAIFHGYPLVEFPTVDNTYYQNLLSSVSGSFNSGVEPMLTFDGNNDYAAIQNLFYTHSGEISKLTVSAWVKVPPDGGDWAIVDFDRSEYYNCIVGIKNTRINNEGDYVGFHTRASSGGIKDMWSSSTIRDNEWHHIVWVFDSEQVYDKKIYIDNQLDSQQDAYSTNVGLGSGANRYGFLGDGSEANSYNANRNKIYFQGSMNKVSIWHKAFSANEISYLENIPESDYDDNDLVAYWPMDEGSGNTLNDKSNNNNNAITFNNPTWGTRQNSGQGTVSNETITISSLNNENTLMHDGTINFNNCTINGPGKILVSGDLTFSGGTLTGSIDIISGGKITADGTIIGNSLTNSCVLYSTSDILITASTIYGIIICNGENLKVQSSSSINGAIYSNSVNTEINSSAVTGSVVSKYSLSLESSTLNKGSLPQIFGTSYGFKNMIIPGSYKEF